MLFGILGDYKIFFILDIVSIIITHVLTTSSKLLVEFNSFNITLEEIYFDKKK